MASHVTQGRLPWGPHAELDPGPLAEIRARGQYRKQQKVKMEFLEKNHGYSASLLAVFDENGENQTPELRRWM